MEVFCKCGYEGNQIVEFETIVPDKRLKETHYYGFFDYVTALDAGGKTLNWSCPKCGKLLVQQRGGLSYNNKELKDMFTRLVRNSWENKRWYKDHQSDASENWRKKKEKLLKKLEELDKKNPCKGEIK